MQQPQIRFSTSNLSFFKTVRSRVDDYFKKNNLSKFGGSRMFIKSIVILSIYLTPFVFITCGFFDSFLINLLLYILMGFGMASIGLAIMHDANHGSYSKNKKINRFFSWTMNFIGGHSVNWQIQHNTLHHTYTNIHDHDEDIAPVDLLRFSPHAPLKKIHRFQYIYAWFFYGLMTLMWTSTKDFKQLNRYEKEGLLKQAKLNYGKELFTLILSKLIYFVYILGIPLFFSGLPWYYIVVGFLVMHFVAGLTLAIIFQPAHVIEDTEFPLPNETGNIENDWAVHQLYTTANFAPKNKLLSWFIGGLNYQIEHHLFPTISHIHYSKISQIVKDTAKEFNYPYIEKPTLVNAIISHTKTLKRLGRE